MNRIYGNDIVLREYKWEDLTDIRSWVADPETAKWLGQSYLRPQTYEQTESYLRSFLEGDAGGLNYAIADRETDRYIGQINLFRMDNQARHAEMAIVLCPDMQGKGVGREAVVMMLKCAFMTWNLHRVYLSVDERNERAISCYKSCGFIEEGRLRCDRFADGRYYDTIQMGILAEEWQKTCE